MRQTTILKHKEVQKEWFLVDATGVTLGKLATLVASYLRGKHKNTFTPHVDMGDNVIVVNSEKIILKGDKETKKLYYSHSGYPGGLKVINAANLRAKKPKEIVWKAISGMLPHTKLGDKQRRNLFVYVGSEHKNVSQKPKKLEVK